MKIILLFLILVKSLAVQSQFSIYPASDPRSFIVDTKFISSHSISSFQSESYISSKFMGSGITYFDSLGRLYCYDSFDSLGKVRYTGHYYYESKLTKPNKFIGILHSSVIRYEENFYPVYEWELLKTDSSDQNFGTTYFFYDSLGREIKQVSIFKDSNRVRTILKGYSDLSNNLIWLKDYFKKNGNEYLDSYRQFYYDKKSNLLKEEELITNTDSTSNTNRGTILYFYNEHGLKSQIIEPFIVNEFEYNLNCILSKYTCFFKDTTSIDRKNFMILTNYKYTFY